MKKSISKMMSVFLGTAFVLGISGNLPAGNISQVEASDNRSIVTFGNYWQEDTNGDGVADKYDDKTPINWIVLKKYDDGTAFVMSEKVLDYQMYSELNYGNVTWETSYIRGWLNNTFYNDAFSVNEKKAIKLSDVKNDYTKELHYKKNKTTIISGGNNTKDYIYLLSSDEATDPQYGFEKEWLVKDPLRNAGATDYANGIDSYASCWWWLRSIGIYKDEFENVSVGNVQSGQPSDGHESGGGLGIRPVMKIDIKAAENASVKSYYNEWVDGKWYDAEGKQTYSGRLTWESDASGWWVEDSDGWYPVNSWQKIDGTWYFFKADGYMAAS